MFEIHIKVNGTHLVADSSIVIHFFISDAVEGLVIEYCDGPACGFGTCENNGLCTPNLDTNTFTCECLMVC